jgi:acetate CoA/acetoacetate CoA-transferase beta subunit
MASPKEIIGKRIAKLFKDGDLVNLGIGMPTAVANYLPNDVKIILHSENGFVGLGPTPPEGQEEKDVVNAGGQPVTILSGGACFDSAMSFAIIRGGHVAATVLGALQVDEQGNLANWMIPGKMVPGMGGAMDLVAGARKVIIAMEHAAKDGSPKILKLCNLPLTASKEVDFIVTELGFMEVTTEGIVLKELVPGVTVEDIQAKTEAKLIIPQTIAVME